ncbi:MAG: A/G-specific adenine glycosylase [Paracoccaceae bacterium]
MRDDFDGAPVAEALLRWYDEAARVLPWRVPPVESRDGALPDPYHVWLSEVMLQQTTVATVRSYFQRFTQRWPTVQALAAADETDVMAEWAGLGYYARARNLIACARVVTDLGGFPRTREELRALPGIGDYTSAAIASIAFGQSETVVDGNVERVVSRLFAHDEPMPKATSALVRLAGRLTPAQRAGDFAQAMMDLGATVCTPRNPRCAVCPLGGFCKGFAAGIAAELPRKAPRKPKPTRRGFAYVATREDGAVLLETREPRGLLGGMPGWLCSAWVEDLPEPAPPSMPAGQKCRV